MKMEKMGGRDLDEISADKQATQLRTLFCLLRLFFLPTLLLRVTSFYQEITILHPGISHKKSRRKDHLFFFSCFRCFLAVGSFRSLLPSKESLRKGETGGKESQRDNEGKG